MKIPELLEESPILAVHPSDLARLGRVCGHEPCRASRCLRARGAGAAMGPLKEAPAQGFKMPSSDFLQQDFS
jgi:hypothetical protein